MSSGYPDLIMEPQQNQLMPTFNLQNQPECQNTHQYFRLRQHIQTNLNTEQGEKNNEQWSDFNTKIFYVGNLSLRVTKEDLYELFGFNTSSYLQKTCKVQLFVCPKTSNSSMLQWMIRQWKIFVLSEQSSMFDQKTNMMKIVIIRHVLI